MNPCESSPKALRILSQSLANPLPKSRESLQILPQSLVNPCESTNNFQTLAALLMTWDSLETADSLGKID